MTAAAGWRALGCAVRLVVTDPRRLHACQAGLADWLDLVDRTCSRARPDSEILAVDTAHGRPTAISPLLADAVEAALRAAELTGGLVDPTVGDAPADSGRDRDFGLVHQRQTQDQYHGQDHDQNQGHDRDQAHDTEPVRLAVHRRSGWRKIVLERASRTGHGIVTVPAGVRLDLGATMNAWAADRAAAALAEAHGCGVLVGLGGDVATAGPAPEDPRTGKRAWRITVRELIDATAPDERKTQVDIGSGGLATSGARGGVRPRHIIDPRTGLSAQGPWRTVSVTAATCLDADIAATSAIVRGTEAPAWLAERGLPGRLVADDGRVRLVAGWPEDPGPGRGPVGAESPDATEG
jgi:thiamine biosynthesis lipoprotein